MFCENCGKQVNNDAQFCNHCGQRLNRNISNKSNNELDNDIKGQNKKSGCLPAIIKLVLIITTVLIFITNYKILSFNNGIKFTESYNETNDIVKDIKTILEIQNMYYYKNPFEDNYRLIIETQSKSIMYKITETELTLIKSSSLLLGKKYDPEEIKVIPWWISIIIIFIIVIIPFSRKRPIKSNS